MRRLYRRVVIESPFGGPTPEAQEENLRYLRACMRDCLDRGEAPYASHGLYTQPGVLDDWDPQEREKGILAGFEWRSVAQATIVYADRGITKGMRAGIRKATELQSNGTFDHYVEYRFLGGEWSALGGPEEIRKHLDHLLDGEEPKHRHLALVTGPHPSPRTMHVMPTPAELSMAHVSMVKKVESPTGPSGFEDGGSQQDALATQPFVRLEVPNGPRAESYERAMKPHRLCENCATLEHRHTYAQHRDGGSCSACECRQFATFARKPPHVPGCIVPNCPGCDDGDPVSEDEMNATVGAGVPSRSYTRSVAEQAAANAQLDRISEATRFAENRMIKDAQKFEGEFGEVPAGRMSDGKVPTLDPHLNYRHESDRPLTLDEVKDALKKGGDERTEAEKTIKRPPRH